MSTEELTDIFDIARLGHAGDGVTADGVFVPYTLPGERVRATREGTRAKIVEILAASPDRATPPCRHFGACGGCALQHLRMDAYLAWKRELVITALAQRGFSDVPVDPILSVASRTRRRATFKAQGQGRTARFGFYEPDSRNLVDLTECPILDTTLATLMPRLRAALGKILNAGESGELYALHSESGIDVDLKLKRARHPDLLMSLAMLANDLDLARLTWNGEAVAVRRPPSVAFGAFRLVPPPGAFLQPTLQGEAILTRLVAEALGEARHVADLFSGCGTFALNLLTGRRVHGVESEEAMLAAMAAAARGANGLTTERRDLFRNPLAPEHLARFEAVVLDPPRPGAKAQSEALARSRLPKIVYVSCSAASFARDARILADGGYRITRVAPVDQFLWSPHVELVASFEKV